MINWLFLCLLVAAVVAMTVAGIVREKMTDTMQTAGVTGFVVGLAYIAIGVQKYDFTMSFNESIHEASFSWAGLAVFAIGYVLFRPLAKRFGATVDMPRAPRHPAAPRTNYGLVAAGRTYGG